MQNPHGIWYTPVTGIWQTVWLEPVPKTYIRGLVITPDPDQKRFVVSADVVDPHPDAVVLVMLGSVHEKAANVTRNWSTMYRVGVGSNAGPQPQTPPLPIDLESIQWSPTNPHLIEVRAVLVNGKVTNPIPYIHQFGSEVFFQRSFTLDKLASEDRVASYTAMRKTSLGTDEHGVNRLLLNNKPLFQYGPLDQGWWPDGLYTAPTDEALKFDIETTKQYGFNMIRKHVKVEPARWYYWADKLGMLVWQDMPSGDTNAKWDPFGKFDGTELTRSMESADCYRKEWQAIIDARRNHPSIVMWVPFNEAWGQFDTVAVTKWTKEYDPTRLVNCTVGGERFSGGRCDRRPSLSWPVRRNRPRSGQPCWGNMAAWACR